MRKNNILLAITTLFATIVGLYVIPQFVRLATESPDDYPYVQYSSGLKELVILNFGDEERNVLSTESSATYTEAQGDSLLPIFNFYQLMAKGQQPDSIEGMEVNMQIIRTGSTIFRHEPSEVNSLREPLHTLFEAMPRRGGLKVPSDLFRLDDKIEFIDAQSNTVDKAKSALFQDMLVKRGYTFPSQWNIGNPNPRKSYDEGYFSLDADGDLFHIKMVNSRPYIRDTKVGDSVEIAHFAIYEVPNKRFYGFVYSRDGGVYILEEGYHLLKLDIPSFDIYNEQMLIVGNILYWTITITNDEGRKYYALRNSDLSQVDRYSISRTENRWDMATKYLLPTYIMLQGERDELNYPRLRFGGCRSFVFSLVLAVGYFIFRRKSALTSRLFASLLILLTGVAGLLAVLLLPLNTKK